MTINTNYNANLNLVQSNTNTTQSKRIPNLTDFAKDKSQAVKEMLGFGVDNEGFFTSDFNAAAGIPNNYKIFADDAKSFVDFHQKRSDTLATHNKIDIAKSIGNAYKVFSQLVPQNSNANFSNEELAKIPYAFIVDRNHNVKQTYNYDEYTKLDSIHTNKGDWQHQSFNTWNVSSGFSKINADTIFNTYSDYTINIHKSAYQNADGSIKAGGVLMAFLNTSNLFGINSYAEGETNLLGKVLGLDKNLNANEIKEFNRFMNANKIQSSFGENNDSWNMIEEQLSLQFYIKRSEATGDKELSKEASKFAQEYQEMIHSSASLEEFKEKYLDFKARHEEFVKKLNEKEKTLLQNTEQKSEELRKLFKPIQVTSKSETYQDIDSLNTLEFIKSQQKLEQILMLFQRESKGTLNLKDIESFMTSSWRRLDREA